MSSVRILAAAALFAIPPANGQRVSAGILGGVSVTSGFPNETLVTPGTTPIYSQYSSSAGDYLVGALVEIRLPWKLGIEADGIYRPLNFISASSSVPQSASLKNTVLSWQFPVLLKYRISERRVTPLIEGGPSFRASGNRNDTALSNHGITAGAGLEFRAGPAAVAPTLRFTRWARDTPPAFVPGSRQNQAEFVVGLSF